jgi:hypothetical protein
MHNLFFASPTTFSVSICFSCLHEHRITPISVFGSSIVISHQRNSVLPTRNQGCPLYGPTKFMTKMFAVSSPERFQGPYLWGVLQMPYEAENVVHEPRLYKDCKWFKPGLGFSCKAKDIGLKSFVQCLEKDSFICPFSVSYAYTYYCNCPARIYMIKELET